MLNDGDGAVIAPPEDPKTMFSRLKDAQGKVLAYTHLQHQQRRFYGELRENAVRQTLDRLPPPQEQIDQKTADTLRAMGKLRIVHEAGRLVDWLSVEAPDMDVHPAREALAKIGTLGTAPDRARLESSVTNMLLDAHKNAEDKATGERIKNTQEDIYGAGLAQHLLEK